MQAPIPDRLYPGLPWHPEALQWPFDADAPCVWLCGCGGVREWGGLVVELWGTVVVKGCGCEGVWLWESVVVEVVGWGLRG